MEEEYLWGLTLSSGEREHEWNPVDQKGSSREERRDPTVRVGHRLLLKQTILNKTAKLEEVNIVQVETSGYAASQIKTPIAYLIGGSVHQRFLDILLPEAPVKFTLTSGDGPVHLVGSHCIEYSYSTAEDTEDLEEEEEADEEIDQEELDDLKEDAQVEAKKRKAGKKPEPLIKAKKLKMDAQMDEEEEEEEEEDMEDEDEAWREMVVKQIKKQGKLKKEAGKKQTAKKAESVKKSKKVK